MATAAASRSTLASLAAMAGIVVLLFGAAFAGVLAAVLGPGRCADSGVQADASAHAHRGIPARYLELYRAASRTYGVPWQALAAIGSIESDHGRAHAAGVRAGVNRHGCCAGPMQFNLTDGPPSTWQRYRVDANHDGHTDVYDPDDAIPSAANYLRALLRGADGDLRRAVLGYNHSPAYADDVLTRARAYVTDSADDLTDSSIDLCAAAGPADLRGAQRVSSPRAYRQLPTWAMAGGRPPELVDARLYPDIVWVLRRYQLRVNAAREAGHHTHGDGTAVDLVPADGSTQDTWDASAGRLADDLGWTRSCAASGSRPACPLVPAIQFVGYDGYPDHGSPRTCSGDCPAHIHVSWVSPCFGSAALAQPCRWVEVISVPPSDAAS